MKPFRLLAGLLLCGLTSTAQVPTPLDSLHIRFPQVGPPEQWQEAQRRWRVASSSRDPRLLGEVFYRLGKLYRGIGDFRTAQYWFVQAQRRWEPLGPSADLVRLHVQFGSVLGPLRRPRDVFNHAHRALSIARRLRSTDSTHCLMSAHVVLAGIHGWDTRTAGNLAPQLSLDSAYRYLSLALGYARQLNKPDELPGIHFNIAGYWSARRDYRRALPHLRTALDGYARLGHHHNTAVLAMNLAQALLTLGQVSSAGLYLDSARRECGRHRIATPTLTADLEHVTAQLYRQTGRYRLADDYQRRADEARLKALETDHDAAVARLSVEFETEKRDAQIKNQQHELALRAAALTAERREKYAVAGLLLVVTAAGILLFRLNQTNRRISRQYAGLVTEQSHRIKNHLQAVANLLGLQAFRLTEGAAKNAVAESQLRVQAIGLLHRRLYDQPEPLAQVALNAYIPDLIGGILKTYGLNAVQPAYDLAPVWLPADQTLPLGLILNEVVTNACKYAFPDQPTPRLLVSLQRLPDAVRVVVADNGPGFTPKAVTQSYGLRLIELQVEQLYGQFAFRRREGTRFELTFPLKSHASLEPVAG